jgi:multidrug efflux pump subunit AcrA (membrane-fusion protein)
MEAEQMTRVLVSIMMGLFLTTGFPLGPAFGAELKVIQTQKTKDVVMTLLSESGQWTRGKNSFVLAFASANTQEPVDVGKVTLSTSMPMPGMSPMIAGATLAPDDAPGRYQGTISFPDSGARQVTVTWDGPAGKGSTRFSVPVR